jgi:hypothetical protein
MKAFIASIFAALFALATASVVAAPITPSGIVVSADGDEEKGDAKTSTEQKDEDADKDKDKDQEKKD